MTVLGKHTGPCLPQSLWHISHDIEPENSENELLQWLREQHQHSRAVPLWALGAKRPENNLNYFTIWGHLSHRQDVTVNTSSK